MSPVKNDNRTTVVSQAYVDCFVKRVSTVWSGIAVLEILSRWTVAGKSEMSSLGLNVTKFQPTPWRFPSSWHISLANYIRLFSPVGRSKCPARIKTCTTAGGRLVRVP